MTKSRVLVVEDERIVALHLRQQLTKLGYEVVAVAFRGDQALRQVEEGRPDLVLMDIHLEGEIDGIETASRIHATFGTPVVFLSAHSEESTLQRARATRPFGYLLKPFSERELHATIQMVLERRTVELALKESEERLRLALDAAEMGSWELDPETHTLSPAGQAARIFGFAHEIVCGPWEEFLQSVLAEDRAQVSALFDCVTGVCDKVCQVEFRSLRDGAVRWLKLQGRAFQSADGRGRRIIGVVQDITEHRAAEERLRQAATVFEATQDGILIFDAGLRVLSVNQGFCDMTGQTESELTGRDFHWLAESTESSERERTLALSILRHSGRWEGELRARRKDGEAFPLLVKLAAVSDDQGLLTHYVGICSDISAVRHAESELKHLAHYDPLTGLPNRLLAMDRLEHAMERSMRENERIGLLFIDLDHFKTINDTLGHSVGDDLLRQVATRMRDAVRPEDTVARLGGDEFMVVIEQVGDVEGIAQVARKIIDLVSLPINSGAAGTLRVSASVGISLYPEDGVTRETLIRAADTAMYAAKDLGRNRYAFYTPEMTASAVAYMHLKQDLRRGLEEGELRLHFQPQISLATDMVTGLEALIRWQPKDADLQGAAVIVPVAEKSGLIMEIGEWVVRESCRQARYWQDRNVPPLRIALNVSPQQMNDGRLLRVVDDALRESAVAPGLIEIEITESMLQDEVNCVSRLHALQEMGLTLAIDDFGTGYSCLASLKSLPIQRLKIDRSFVQDLPYDRNSMAITEAIIAMGHRLEMEVIAEGVETPAQEEFLRALGCEEVQGFLHAEPMPAAAVEAFVGRYRSRRRS